MPALTESRLRTRDVGDHVLVGRRISRKQTAALRPARRPSAEDKFRSVCLLRPSLQRSIRRSAIGNNRAEGCTMRLTFRESIGSLLFRRYQHARHGAPHFLVGRIDPAGAAALLDKLIAPLVPRQRCWHREDDLIHVGTVRRLRPITHLLSGVIPSSHGDALIGGVLRKVFAMIASSAAMRVSASVSGSVPILSSHLPLPLPMPLNQCWSAVSSICGWMPPGGEIRGRWRAFALLNSRSFLAHSLQARERSCGVCGLSWPRSQNTPADVVINSSVAPGMLTSVH